MKQFLFSFDSTVTHAIQALPQGLYPLMYALSFVGRPVFTIGMLIVIAVISIIQHKSRLLIASGVAMLTFAFCSVLKIIIHRPRPSTYNTEDVILPTFSFPSGHAASTAVVFGLLAYILWKVLPGPWGLIAAISLAILIVCIGISRVYLGAHYPSDVVAGWIVGCIGLAIIIWVVQPL